MGAQAVATRSTRTTSITAGTTPSRRALTIAPGETVQFETVDASSGQLTRESTAADLERLDLARVNPVTGPVYIDGAEPGDALKVTVLSLRPSGWGWTGNIPGFGLLTRSVSRAPACITGTTTRAWRRRCTALAAACRCSRSPAPSASRPRSRGCTASFRRATWAATWTYATSPRAPSSTCRSR